MSASVICVSHADGALGRAVAERIAETLGFELVDDAILVDAAEREGVFPEAVALAEHRSTGRTIEVDFGRYEKTEAVRDLIRDAIAAAADRGSAVIVAHAASYALAGREGVLRVLVTASDDTRARRVGEELGLDEKAARKALAESDKGRLAYLKAFYGAKAERADDYDVVVNTDRLTVDAAAAVVAAGA